MGAKFSLKVMTPEKSFIEETVDSVVFETSTGQMGILHGHMPVVAAVVEGVLKIQSGESWRDAAIGQGFVTVKSDESVFYVETAEWAEDIDVARARQAMERAALRLRNELSQLEYFRTQAALSRAMARLRASSDTNRSGDRE